MFNARHISLASGQSYEMPIILERKDYETYGIYDLSGPLTLCFMADGMTVVLNQWNLLVLKLDNRQRSGRRSKSFARILLDRDIVYTNCDLIYPEDYEYAGIPKIIGDGLSQVVWSCGEGTFITHDANIVSMIDKDVRGGRTSKVVPRNALHVQPDVLGEVSAQSIHKKIG